MGSIHLVMVHQTVAQQQSAADLTSAGLYCLNDTTRRRSRKSNFYDDSWFGPWLSRRVSALEFSPELQISAQIVAATVVRQSTVQVDPRSLRLAGTAVAQQIVVR